jgi:16S rRNA (uracil1498-N3)-methyltransferase
MTAASATRRIVLIQALPKGAKLDGIVRACTELGVYAIRLAFSERSVPRPESQRAEERCRRLARIAKEASALAGRSGSPEISFATPLLDVAAQAPESARRVVFWESSTQKLEVALADPGRPELGVKEDVWIVVGPEGGLSESEIAALRECGYRDATLGTSVLRVETAAPLAVGLVLYLLGALNRG